MKTSVAFLRGMNVGGHRVTNAELQSIFAKQLNFSAVATYRASGNVIFQHDEDIDPAALQQHIEAELEDSLGYPVPTFVRGADELAAITARAPFPADRVASSKGKLQVTMLPKKPSARARARALALSTDADRLAIHGRELYWLPSGGVSDAALDLNALEQALGTGTTRTLGTLQGIARKCDAASG